MSDFLEREEFLKHMSQIFEAFPATKSRARIDRVYYYMQALPVDAIKDICNLMLDTYKQTPIPSDFKKEAGDWKRRNNWAKDDPFAETRAIIAVREQSSVCCEKCKNSGIVQAYSKFKGLASVVFHCHCSVGELARNLPEYRNIARKIEKDSPYWFIFEFDKNLSLKMDLYRHINADPEIANPVIADLYYGAEVYLDPCYYKPADWQPEPLNNPWPSDMKTGHKPINFDVKEILKIGMRNLKKDEHGDYL